MIALKKQNKKELVKENIFQKLFFMSAMFSVVSLLFICLFLFLRGVPAIREIGLFKFLTGLKWRPVSSDYGIFPMIVGSLYVSAGAVLFGVPPAVLCAIFLSKFCPKRLYKIFRPAMDLLAGIPSVVYGLFGLFFMVPLVRFFTGGSGKGILTASVLLGIMILPTVTGIAESAIRTIPDNSEEGALALGATEERSVFCVVLPEARSGILAGIILGIGRAFGETMAVVMVAGNQEILPESILSGVRTMTSNIVIEMSYAESGSIHQGALIATGAVLFVFILIMNVSFSLLKKER